MIHEVMEVNDNIKERILFFAKYQGISIETFLLSIGMTYGSFKGKAKKGSINSNALIKIYTNYPNIDFHWLLTGSTELIIETAEKIKSKIRDRIETGDFIVLSKILEVPRNTAVSRYKRNNDNAVMIMREIVNNRENFISLQKRKHNK